MSQSWVPSFLKESYKGGGEIAIRSQLLTDRTIFLQGEITEETANEFLLQMLYLKRQGSEPVNLYINSGGGSVNAGMAIYDMIQSMDMEVNIYCVGIAASMAAIILAGGQQGHRFILPHSRTMIHEPMISQGVGELHQEHFRFHPSDAGAFKRGALQAHAPHTGRDGGRDLV